MWLITCLPASKNVQYIPTYEYFVHAFFLPFQTESIGFRLKAFSHPSVSGSPCLFPVYIRFA